MVLIIVKTTARETPAHITPYFRSVSSRTRAQECITSRSEGVMPLMLMSIAPHWSVRSRWNGQNEEIDSGIYRKYTGSKEISPRVLHRYDARVCTRGKGNAEYLENGHPPAESSHSQGLEGRPTEGIGSLIAQGRSGSAGLLQAFAFGSGISASRLEWSAGTQEASSVEGPQAVPYLTIRALTLVDGKVKAAGARMPCDPLRPPSRRVERDNLGSFHRARPASGDAPDKESKEARYRVWYMPGGKTLTKRTKQFPSSYVHPRTPAGR